LKTSQFKILKKILGGCVKYLTSACWENVIKKTTVGTRFEVGSGYPMQTIDLGTVSTDLY
jgi:hypothetical protein